MEWNWDQEIAAQQAAIVAQRARLAELRQTLRDQERDLYRMEGALLLMQRIRDHMQQAAQASVPADPPVTPGPEGRRPELRPVKPRNE